MLHLRMHQGHSKPPQSYLPLAFLLLLWCRVVVSTGRIPFDVVTAFRGGQSKQKDPIVIGIDGGTESIRACCFDARTGRAVGKSCAVPYDTRHPQPGWAEQEPADWYTNLAQAVRGTLKSLPDDARVSALCVDTTCCSVVVLDANGDALRPCLLWMDQRAATQAQEILETCRGDPALLVNCHGQGPLSAEWMMGKALWIKQQEPDIWQKAATICEYQDFINLKLTGRLVASACNAATRWHWDAEEAVLMEPSDENPYPGRPMSVYRKLDMPELADKLPQTCLPMGSRIGCLTAQAAKDLGLPEDTPVVQGGPDAFVGMIGLGCVHNKQLCLITGSSHLHCVVTDSARTAPGTWGAYRGAPLPGLFFAEGGQSSTGSLLRWARNLFGGESDLSYALLDEMAATIPPGADGLVALETFQGSRTPVTDPMAKGAFLGLTLSHSRSHVWRALMEAVCFGTRACMEGLAAAGHGCDEIILAGGIAKSPLWLQMHADVTGKPIVVCENTDAPLLGCAILAAVGVGIHPTVPAAIESMVRVSQRLEPNAETHATYTQVYQQIYQPMVESVRGISHALHSFRGGAETTASSDASCSTAPPQRNRNIIISPSLLACDWGNIRYEVQRCLQAGACRLHVDIFDGVFLDSPLAFTFGPSMVKVIHESVKGNPDAILDLHMCVQKPHRFVDCMAKVAPGHCFVFQWEAVSSLAEARALAQHITEAGMQCGVSLNPSTPFKTILPLLETRLVSVIDILAVEPGFGGQQMQTSVLSKVYSLRKWIQEHSLSTLVMVDGGVNEETAASVLESGADILVSGSFLFQQDLAKGIKTILSKAL